jgi:sulfatase maturation enzyme AslB (radical SAM superfamily)
MQPVLRTDGLLTMKNTFCPRLWDEVFIDQKGKVYSCCHFKPQAVGSIYHRSLEEIYSDLPIQKFREQALSGKLRCFKRCNLLQKDELEQSSAGRTAQYAKPLRLKIQFGELCNLDCIMCWQDSKSPEVLNYDQLIKNVPLKDFESIEIQGGEPLFIKSAKQFFIYAGEQGKKVSFLTNGMLINDAWAEKIALHSSFIHFSLNAATKETHEFVNKGSQWERVLKNIQRVRDFRDRYKTELRISGHMTIVTKNIREIPLFIQKFSEFGFDTIDFGYDLRVPFFLMRHPFLKQDLRQRIKTAIDRIENKSLIRGHRLSLLGLL